MQFIPLLPVQVRLLFSGNFYGISTFLEESSRTQEDAPMLTTLIPAVKTTPISMHSVGTLQSRVIALNQENYHANMVAGSSNAVMETSSSQCDYCKLFFSTPAELTKHKKRKRLIFSYPMYRLNFDISRSLLPPRLYKYKTFVPDVIGIDVNTVKELLPSLEIFEDIFKYFIQVL